MYSIPASAPVYWLVHHLAKSLPADEREPLFLDLLRTGAALAVACHITQSIDSMHQPEAQERDSVFQEFTLETVAAMRAAVAERLKQAADDGRLVDLPDLFFNLRQWDRWGTPEDVKTWFGQTV